MGEYSKKTLNDILDDYHLIESKIIENDGELDDDLETLLSLNTSELEMKLDGYEGFIKYLDGQINYLKEMEAHYMKRMKVLVNTKKKCRDSMVRAFSSTDSKKIKTSNYNFTMCESESWTVDTENLTEDLKSNMINDGLAKNIFKVSVSEVKNKYKEVSIEDKPEWITIDKKKYIRVS
jgi:hypothetical protein